MISRSKISEKRSAKHLTRSGIGCHQAATFHHRYETKIPKKNEMEKEKRQHSYSGGSNHQQVVVQIEPKLTAGSAQIPTGIDRGSRH